MVALCVSASAKTGSTIYTPERVQNARHNIERYDWAKKIRDSAVAAADKWVNQPDEWLWQLPTSQDIPRGIHVNRQMGCPKCGHAIDKFGNYPWKCDVIAKPWKTTCPNCAEVFPKNDFAKFYASGLDSNGVFHYTQADRSLLFNSDHRDPKDPLHNYGVDDSRGWTDEKGNIYRFIGYYGHYGTWTAVSRALADLRSAYVYTGDLKYAGKAALLLYRVAELYPDMDYSACAKLGFENSDGGSGMGKVFGRIWETGMADGFVESYDAIFPALEAPELLVAVSKQAGKRVASSGYKGLITANILRQVHAGIINRTIEGNEGMYQYTMALAAVALDEHGTTEQWLDWIFADGDVRHTGLGGGNMKSIFANKVDDDGMGNEASPAYNSIWRSKFADVSDVISRYAEYKNHRILDNPKFKKMFQVPVRLTCIGRFHPHIGDTGSCGSPGLASIRTADLVYAYKTFKDPEFAQMAYKMNGNSSKGLRGDIFDAEPESIGPEIQKIVKERGPYIFKTDNMPSYGCAILRSGEGDNARALSLYYGRNTGHGHKDTLNIELFGHGIDLMPDLGYPEYAFSDCASRLEWTENTISHNTVVVDQKPQERQVVGLANFVVEGSGVSAAEVCAGKPYPQTSLYQRTLATIDLTDKDFCVVDIFRVKGGEHHMYSLHGAEGQVETEGLALVDQPKGTLAGEDVPPYDETNFKSGRGAVSNGYQYLYDIRRDSNPSSPLDKGGQRGVQPAVTYKVVDTWHLLKEPKDIRLRVNLLDPPGEVILAHGDPPRNKPGNPKNLTYILLPDKSTESTFVSVIEPYVGARTISKIERKDDGDTVTVKITTASGRVDTIISALKPINVTIGGCKVSGRFAVVSQEPDTAKGEVRCLVAK